MVDPKTVGGWGSFSKRQLVIVSTSSSIFSLATAASCTWYGAIQRPIMATQALTAHAAHMCHAGPETVVGWQPRCMYGGM